MDNELALEILNRIDKNHAEYMKIFARQDKRFEEQDKKFDEHGKKIDDIDALIKQHSEDIASIKKSLLLIEDAVTDKIPALFDAFMVNRQKNEEQDNNIHKLEKTSEFHSLKISILENTSKKHSEQLNRLLS